MYYKVLTKKSLELPHDEYTCWKFYAPAFYMCKLFDVQST